MDKDYERKQNKAQTKRKTIEQQDSMWDKMIQGIVRPPRAKYQEYQLGTKVINYKDKFYVREEHKVIHEGKNIDVTLYLAEKRNKYIILYMHGNSSCRLEALGMIKCIPERVSLACFDFMGCGKNQQSETISLGFRQSQQAKSVTEHLRSLGFNVILWGRSMGAATSLLYGDVDFIVADSSFKSFKSLCKQVAKQHSPTVVPNFMINCFFPCVFTKLRNDIDKKAKYDVVSLDIRQAVRRLNPLTTVVFMSGNKDRLIASRNSTKLYNECPCIQKYLKVFEGDHNSRRPENILNQVMQLIKEFINQKDRNQILASKIIQNGA